MYAYYLFVATSIQTDNKEFLLLEISSCTVEVPISIPIKVKISVYPLYDYTR